MTTIDIVVISIIALWVVASIIYVATSRKKGKCIGCSQCDGCNGHCRSCDKVKKGQ